MRGSGECGSLPPKAPPWDHQTTHKPNKCRSEGNCGYLMTRDWLGWARAGRRSPWRQSACQLILSSSPLPCHGASGGLSFWPTCLWRTISLFWGPGPLMRMATWVVLWARLWLREVPLGRVTGVWSPLPLLESGTRLGTPNLGTVP